MRKQHIILFAIILTAFCLCIGGAYKWHLGKLEEERRSVEKRTRKAIDATDKLFRPKLTGEEIRLLVADGANVNEQKRGFTPLMYAAQSGEAEAVVALLQSGADVNASDAKGRTALMYAAQDNNLDVINAFLESSADVNVSDGKGRTSLMYAAQYSKDEKTLKAIIDKGADIDAHTNEGWTSLMLAAYNNKNIKTIKILLDSNANPDKTSISGNTALIFALFREDDFADEIRTMIVNSTFASSIINKTDNRKRTPLIWAVKLKRDKKTLEALINAGSDVNAAMDDGRTPLMLAAARDGNPEDILATLTLLVKSGADVARSDAEKRNAIYYARNNKALVKHKSKIDNILLVKKR
ncbi:MAG: ankyrin repeat domain-containing protein [Synergistaceae bacterium]|jgi:ankyrin repeat protein|nr:ankyrin repeat domain-containing protein [Synergistaceae bacterium]